MVFTNGGGEQPEGGGAGGGVDIAIAVLHSETTDFNQPLLEGCHINPGGWGMGLSNYKSYFD